MPYALSFFHSGSQRGTIKEAFCHPLSLYLYLYTHGTFHAPIFCSLLYFGRLCFGERRWAVVDSARVREFSDLSRASWKDILKYSFIFSHPPFIIFPLLSLFVSIFTLPRNILNPLFSFLSISIQSYIIFCSVLCCPLSLVKDDELWLIQREYVNHTFSSSLYYSLCIFSPFPPSPPLAPSLC